MKCPQCQTNNRDAAYFCRRCGIRLATENSATDLDSQPDDSFCDVCGADLTLGAHSASRGLTDVTEHYIATGANPEGERKQVTVLFADIADSTSLIAGRDPEDERELLDPVIELMTSAVHMYGGIISKQLGDGVMALFGAPLSHEDHALRACCAALRIHQNIARSTTEQEHEFSTSVRIRVGIASGEALLRTIVSDLHFDYSAVGETIHLAARLEEMTEPGTTLCSGMTVRLAEGFVETNALGLTPIRGFMRPVEVFELMDVERARVRFHATTTRGLTQFLGRQQEYETLRRCLQRAEAGYGQVVAMVGEAGVGKSRLTWELTHSDLAAGWRLLEAGTFSFGKDIPYLPIIALFKSYFDIEDRDNEHIIRKKVANKLLALGGPLKENAPAVLSLLGVDAEDPHWVEMDPLRRRGVINRTFVLLMQLHCETQPLIIVVEDLHWIDNETKSLLDSLVDALATGRLILLVNYRPGYDDGWLDQISYTQIHIDPLSAKNAQQLARVLLGDDPTLKALRAQLVDRTEGNPFFLEEIVKTLAEANVLVGQLGSFRMGEGFDGFEVPISVQAVLQSRIDQLSYDDKLLLQAASALGYKFPFTLLSAVAPSKSQESFQAGLARLKDAELLYESSLYPEIEYSFTHALTQEVAYRSLLKDHRRSLHAKIVEAIESVYVSRLSEHIETLAYHAHLGEVWDKAVTYGRMAGQKAAAQSVYQKAVAYFEQSLAAIERLPSSKSMPTLAIDIRFELRNALFPLGEIKRDLEHLRAAEPIANRLGDKHRLAWISAYIARDLSLLGDPSEALESGQRAQSLAPEVHDTDLQVLTDAYLGQAHYALGNYQQSAELLEGCVSALGLDVTRHRFGLPGPATVFFRAWLVWALARLGEFTRGAAQIEEMTRIATTADQPLSLTVAIYTQGYLYVHQADFARAIPLLERSLALCRDWGFPAWFTNIASALGYAYAHSNRVDEGLELLQQAIDRTRSLGVMVSHANEVAWFAETNLMAGRIEEANTYVQTAIKLARKYKERGNEAEAIRLSGEVALRGRSFDVRAAAGCFRQALCLATDCEMKPTIARCHLGLGTLHRRAGDPEKAEEHLGTAVELFRELGMEFWLGEADRDLNALAAHP